MSAKERAIITLTIKYWIDDQEIAGAVTIVARQGGALRGAGDA